MDIETSYKTLALDPGSPFKDIKLAYITKVKQYHPDRYTTESINQQLAENKLKEINLAFKTLMDYFKVYASKKEVPPATTESSDKKWNRIIPVAQPVEDSENHPTSLKKARVFAQKVVFNDANISHLFSASILEYRHARLKADSTITHRMDEISRTESEISRYQDSLDNKYFKKNVFDISRNQKFNWKDLKRRLSATISR